MATKPLTGEEIRAQIAGARARAQRAQAVEPHAAAAHYDTGTRRLVVTLTNGAEFMVPVAQVAELRAASEDELRGVEVGPAGVGLHWPALDADLSVVGLARLVFGSRTVARAAGAQAGAARSETKAEAARRNGAKGGRPRGFNKKAHGGEPYGPQMAPPASNPAGKVARKAARKAAAKSGRTTPAKPATSGKAAAQNRPTSKVR